MNIGYDVLQAIYGALGLIILALGVVSLRGEASRRLQAESPAAS